MAQTFLYIHVLSAVLMGFDLVLQDLIAAN